MPPFTHLPPDAELAPLWVGNMDLAREIQLIHQLDEEKQPETVCLHAARVLEVAVIDMAGKLHLEQGRRSLHLRIVDLHDAGFLAEHERSAFVCLKRIGNDVRHIKRSMQATDARFAKWALILVLDWWAECEAPPTWPGLRQELVQKLSPEPKFEATFAVLCAPKLGDGGAVLQGPIDSWLGGAPVTDDLFALGIERLIDGGHCELALDQLAARAATPGQFIRNRQRELKALAYSRMGDLDQALNVLAEIDNQNFEKPTEECAGIYGGVLKRKWLQTQDSIFLEMALAKYRSGAPASSRDAEDLYCGVNEAACLLWLGKKAEAEKLALTLLRQLDRFNDISHPRRNLAPLEESPWRTLTQAECHLMAQQLDAASTLYASIFKLPGQQGRLDSAKTNLLRHLQALGLANQAAAFGI